MTRQELVIVLDQYLFVWSYKDIETASIHGDAKLAGIILGASLTQWQDSTLELLGKNPSSNQE